MMNVKELPVDVLSKIISYLVGEPEYIKLKHSPALKVIQRNYKIDHFQFDIRRAPKRTEFEFGFTRSIPFPIKSIEYMVEKQWKIMSDFLKSYNKTEAPFTPFCYVEIAITDEYGDPCGKLGSDEKETTFENIEDSLYHCALDLSELIESEELDDEDYECGIQTYFFKLILQKH